MLAFKNASKEYISERPEELWLSSALKNDNVNTKDKRVSYLNASMVGYFVGIVSAFVANEVTKVGQPALFYLVPSVITSIIWASLKNDEFNKLVQMK